MMEIFENVVLPEHDSNININMIILTPRGEVDHGFSSFYPLYKKTQSCDIIINMNIIKSELLDLEIREMYPVFYVYPALHLYWKYM